MATSSTAPTFCAELISLLAAHADLSGVQVEAHWPGPDSEYEMVFLGEQIDWTSEVPNIKAGRKQRQEDYTLTVECWVFGGDGTPATAATTRDRVIALADVVDDVLADDPNLGLGTTIQHAVVSDRTLTLVTFEKGWGAQSVVTVTVNARLT